MSAVLKKARKPAATVTTDTKVIDAIRLMMESRVGATAVVDNGKLRGVFTERDVMNKIVLGKLDPETTPVSKVMTSPVTTVDQHVELGDALQTMLDRHIRHLPIVDREGKVLGMLSMRHVLREQVESLKQEVGALANYIGSDGPGG
jgi:CBS domain-containing protein